MRGLRQLISLLARALEQALVVRHEPVRKAHDLEAVAVADEPELPVIAHLAPAHPATDLVHGSIGARYPAARGGTESRPHSPWLVVGDLFGVQGIANVEHAQACILETAGEHRRIHWIVGDASFFAVVERPRHGEQVRARARPAPAVVPEVLRD